MRRLLPRRISCVLVVSLLAALRAPAAENAPAKRLGFTSRHAEEQLALEKKFDAQLSAADQKAWVEQMASAPNHVGTAHNRANADFMLAQFRAWGWDARIEFFDVLYPTPTKLTVELIAPTKYTANLQEPAIPGDRTSTQIKDELPPYHVFGADGDVTADLVYVNQGMPDDYKELARFGVDVRGKIVIARYGGGWRGLKPRTAYEHGAIGCLVYSDPRDDGYGAGDVYPKGGFRPAESVQRGSVMNLPLYPGDPLTPGVGATADAKRLPISEAKTVLKIPVLPISYADALPLLTALGGQVVPPAWRGALPITYHFGPGPAKVHLAVKSEWSLKQTHNVIAVLKGSERPDEWILRGNHHDAWVFGAWDPLSGNAAMMAEMKAIGALVKAGWRPKRTLVYASWDAEEPAMLGSTEWVETHAAELREKAVLYVNTDTNGRGFLEAEGSHVLQSLVNEVAADVKDPETGESAYTRRVAKMMVAGNQKGADEEARRWAKLVGGGGRPPIGALGSGSDYTAFLDFIGVPSVNLSFAGENDTAGIYHSAYDSFDHYSRFGDPGFVYGVSLAQACGRLVLRAADADVLPFSPSDFADTVAQYFDEVQKLADGLRESTSLQNRLIDEKMYTLAADPTKTYLPPEREAAVPVLNFAPLANAVLRLKQSAKAADEALARLTKTEASSGDPKRVESNTLLRGLERELIRPEGLPGHEWYKHMIYAPGLQTGYGVKTLPGVREAIEDRRWPDAEKFAVVIAERLDAYSTKLDRIAALAQPAP